MLRTKGDVMVATGSSTLIMEALSSPASRRTC